MLTEYQLQRQYGISMDDFEEMQRAQQGRCAICRVYMDLPHVDHNHESGVVRGLLCKHCNTGLGMFKDDVRLLAQAIVYLEDS